MVYVAITSSSAVLVRQVIAQLSTLGLRILVAGTVRDLSDLQSDDVLVAGVLPSQQIMPQVDLGVISGGQGSVQSALASGLPFIGSRCGPSRTPTLCSPSVKALPAACLSELQGATGSPR